MAKTKSELKEKMRECLGKMVDYVGNEEKATEFAQAECEFKAAQAELAVLEQEERMKRVFTSALEHVNKNKPQEEEE